MIKKIQNIEQGITNRVKIKTSFKRYLAELTASLK